MEVEVDAVDEDEDDGGVAVILNDNKPKHSTRVGRVIRVMERSKSRNDRNVANILRLPNDDDDVYVCIYAFAFEAAVGCI